MGEKGKLIRNHPSTVGRWEPSDELQDLTKAERVPEDSCPPDKDPPTGVTFLEGRDEFVEWDDGDGGDNMPAAVCIDCVHCYDNRAKFRVWLDRLLRRTQPARALFCAANPREDVCSPVNGELVYINSIFSTPSKGLAEPDERCQDMNLWGNCPLFKKGAGKKKEDEPSFYGA